MSVTHCPAILIAAPASGQGKTTVAAALARLHTRQGRTVRVFKCGPDFLDPYWHTLASGGPVHQLDLWMTGEADCRARLAAAAREADLIIVEGVMGLFDGEPSAADLAQRFGLPVLVVIDASAMAGTFGALAFGLQHYRPHLPWAGVLANRVASERHAGMLRSSVREPAQWLGALMRNPAMSLPERHLGLTVASEVMDALDRLDAAADALAVTPLGQMSLADLKRWEVAFSVGNGLDAGTETEPGKGRGDQPPNSQPLAGRTVAIARDAAFCFIYAANLDCLRNLGAELVFFSPLTDSVLPDCDAVWLPGGYPELHATRLAANTTMRDSLAKHVAQDKPVWAECGGMMVLFDVLVTVDGQTHAQWGLLPGTVTMQKRLAALGPQQLVMDGGLLRGHTFHYSTCATPLPAHHRTARPDCEPAPDAGEGVYQVGPIRASYFHAWFASSPAATAELFAAPDNPLSASAGELND
ncbi:cobyrinate a,c-diamide synthase [Hydrogenophaga sp.]|uniref:cobyrinate a,c-diamide synthase n=1 Tax=Hydrogenophaga sp. TaxID=1904254 RepID=UPI00273548F9|nr:cobyrinate a,c-diamide synthase [Hydrogenophaga sp.]MDP3325069.1 cobyrinate a,c-diamide synthase [Hydrogenophaga sp.]MDP3883438.1 cobyrinate a,c-diamide synthase [Hydrogenophaga sp.]MDZ4177460.1 cobyrinate a,c-diamide synthase [Hydrogenophaga sp.]